MGKLINRLQVHISRVNRSLFREWCLSVIKLCAFPGIAALIWSCSPEPVNQPDNGARLIIEFVHLVDGSPVMFDTLIYTNAAGNPYLINEIQYFVSDFVLWYGPDSLRLDRWDPIHYVDTDLPYTFTWEVPDKLIPGNVDSISFVFGLTPERNISFMFVNPPERDMFWPEYLGGGYHYMKLNGKWLPDTAQYTTIPFDFHLGRGQIYQGDSIVGFTDNQFTVTLPVENLLLPEGETRSIRLVMNIENWFQDPYIYDHNVYGGYIMQNQEAMEKIKENGYNVFSLQQN
ncbi:MAG: hypothetical protein Kow00127_00860 [Bacteroidales bacterium]